MTGQIASTHVAVDTPLGEREIAIEAYVVDAGPPAIRECELDVVRWADTQIPLTDEEYERHEGRMIDAVFSADPIIF